LQEKSPELGLCRLKMLVMHYSCNIKISSIENYKPFDHDTL
jgi:hypothetical protein